MSEALVDFMVQDGDAGAADEGLAQGVAVDRDEGNHRCHAAETLRGSALQKIRLTRVQDLTRAFPPYALRCGHGDHNIVVTTFSPVFASGKLVQSLRHSHK